MHDDLLFDDGPRVADGPARLLLPWSLPPLVGLAHRQHLTLSEDTPTPDDDAPDDRDPAALDPSTTDPANNPHDHTWMIFSQLHTLPGRRMVFTSTIGHASRTLLRAVGPWICGEIP